MNPRAVQLADAIVADLNAPGNGFGLAFTAARLYVVDFSLEELAELRVSVVPGALDVQGLSRGSDAEQYRIDVGVQQKINPDQVDQVDARLELTQQIDRFLRPRKYELGDPVDATALWIGVDHDPLWLPEHLDRIRVFTAVLRTAWSVSHRRAS